MPRTHGIAAIRARDDDHCVRVRQLLQVGALALPALIVLGCNRQPGHPLAPPPESTVAPARVASEPVAALIASELKEGSSAPDVTLPLQDGFRLSLSSEKGKLVAVYFCSSNNNPDCVREARGLRDHWNELHVHHVVVIGVSRQDSSAHQTVIAEQRLPFDLATDADGRIGQAFHVPTRGEYGPHTFLVGRDGTIRMSWHTANPELHTQEILAVASE